ACRYGRTGSVIRPESRRDGREFGQPDWQPIQQHRLRQRVELRQQCQLPEQSARAGREHLRSTPATESRLFAFDGIYRRQRNRRLGHGVAVIQSEFQFRLHADEFLRTPWPICTTFLPASGSRTSSGISTKAYRRPSRIRYSARISRLISRRLRGSRISMRWRRRSLRAIPQRRNRLRQSTRPPQPTMLPPPRNICSGFPEPFAISTNSPRHKRRKPPTRTFVPISHSSARTLPRHSPKPNPRWSGPGRRSPPCRARRNPATSMWPQAAHWSIPLPESLFFRIKASPKRLPSYP